MIKLTKIHDKDLKFVEENRKLNETNKDTINRLLKELRKRRRLQKKKKGMTMDDKEKKRSSGESSTSKNEGLNPNAEQSTDNSSKNGLHPNQARQTRDWTKGHIGRIHKIQIRCKT